MYGSYTCTLTAKSISDVCCGSCSCSVSGLFTANLLHAMEVFSIGSEDATAQGLAAGLDGSSPTSVLV